MGILSFLFSQEHAKIGGLLIDASVSETHSIEAEVTEYPVENGATVSDHIQVKSPELTMEGVITDAPLGYFIIGNIENIVRSVSVLFGGSKRSIDGYNVLVNLQRNRIPFDVFTTLRKYENMVIKSLKVVRTSATGASIHFTAVLKQINIAVSEVDTSTRLAPVAKNIAAKKKDDGQKFPFPPKWATNERAQIDADAHFSVFDMYSIRSKAKGSQ
jgi:hypothetical protein